MRVQCVLRSEFIAPVRSQIVTEPERRTIAEGKEDLPATTPDDQAIAEAADEKMLGAVVRMFDGEIIED